MMSEKTKRFLKKNGMKLWIIIAVLSLSGMMAFAAYTNQQNKAKKVIATAAKTEMRFSSNYLELGNTKVKTIVKSEDDLVVPVTVRNFGRNNPTLWYASDISYVLSVELTDTSGSSAAVAPLIGSGSVTISDGTTTKTLTASHLSDTFSETLVYSSSDSSQHQFDVTFPSVDSKVCVKIVATPTPQSSYPDLSPISAIIAIADKNNVVSEGWSGEFTDSKQTSGGSNIYPNDYDAYNYSLKGYGDRDSATITWNANKIEPNKQYFYSTFGVQIDSLTPNASGWKTATIALDSTASNGHYDFQFYKVNDPNFSSWIELEGYVIFDQGT